MNEYDLIAFKISKVTTRHYSTSFSLGVSLLDKDVRMPIYAIYGFVRVADEIVDSFHDHDKASLLDRFRERTFTSIEEGISTNPILHSFQWVVNAYNIDHDLIHAFLDSMEMDLTDKKHDAESFKRYVYGSAEVVGLMCLRVFYQDDDEGYQALIEPARKLGEAFQKINFLRDLRSDYKERGRFYFPGINLKTLDEETKKMLEDDIYADFMEARKGISLLNRKSRLGVLVSYTYYLKLFKRIQRSPAPLLFCKRIRVNNARKIFILAHTWLRFKLHLA
jgi:phytoene/squalene synthetase